MLRFSPVLALGGCGYLLRAEVGPTWIENDGPGATIQGTVGGSPVAGYGIFDFIVVGGYGTATPAGLNGGLFFGVDAGVTPGGADQDRYADVRTGVGLNARIHPRVGTDGFAVGGGVAVTTGEGKVVGSNRISFDGHEKGGLSFSWMDRVWVNGLAALDVQHTLVGGTFADGVWRFDALVGIERMVLAD